METKVVKFGGSSLADANQFRKVAQIIKADETRRYVVASAPGKRFKDDIKVTDMLYKCYEVARAKGEAKKEFEEIASRYRAIIADLGIDFDITGELDYTYNAITHHSGRDFAASRGEYLNSLILAKYLGFAFVDAEEVVFFRDDGTFDAEKTNEELKKRLKKVKYAVIPGFYGGMPNGTIKTFSRGGSDITGSLVARAVGASLYENWTDVSGCLMADPRVVSNPLPIPVVTYRELRELSYMGASVLHEDAIFPVRIAGIPINIKNTNKPDDKGTLILSEAPDTETPYVITGIAGKKGLSIINIEKEMMNEELGFGRRVLNILEDNEISFEHMPSGVDTMSVVVMTKALEDKKVRDKVLQSIRKSVKPDVLTVEDGLALLAVVGRSMVDAKGTAARIFRATGEAGINIRMIDQGSSELNIIIGVEEADLNKAIDAIYHEFVRG